MVELYRSLDDLYDVEVNQVTRENVEAVTAWCEGVSVVEHDALDYAVTFAAINVPTLHGMQRAQEGDYIVRQLSGSFVVVKSYEFARKYEALPPPQN